MTTDLTVRPALHLASVTYDIRGPLARRALELERAGNKIVRLNIGNPGAFAFRMPSALRQAMVDHLPESDAYCHQKGIMPAREAVAATVRSKGVLGVTADDVYMGNGASELIIMTMEALLNPGDEVLVPAPDYPLWTAAVTITGARAVHYPCRSEHAFLPDPAEVEKLITSRTKALVIINPNNPTGAVYPKSLVEALVRVAERHHIVFFSDEIYDRILYDGTVHTPAATFCEGTLCGTFGGLSKVYLGCGIRTGWLSFSGAKEKATDYFQALELLSSLRLCSNVPGQWAVPTALTGHQDIYDLTAPTGRLGRQRRALVESVKRSRYLKLEEPKGALYGFVGVKPEYAASFDDARFAMALLEQKHVLVIPGSSFHFATRDHFRTTFLPDEETIVEVFRRIESLLDEGTR